MPLLLIAKTLVCEASSRRLYEYGFDEYEISQVTRIDKLELTKVALNLIDYFNLKAESAQITVSKAGQKLNLFNEQELVRLGYLVRRVTFILIVICALMLLFCLKRGWGHWPEV